MTLERFILNRKRCEHEDICSPVQNSIKYLKTCLFKAINSIPFKASHYA